MKKFTTNSFTFLKRNILIIGVLFATALLVFSQPQDLRFGSDRDVIEDYEGWAGDPDTITIHIDDSSYSDAQKDSIRAAIDRWNGAGCVPKLKEVDAPPANVSIEKSDTLSSAGLYEWTTDADGNVTEGKIYINDTTDPLSLKEVVTHELGHALGLDDVDQTANPSDVMKGTGPSNGTNGDLSAHDSTELAAASAAAIAVPDVEKKNAVNPVKAITPGEFQMLEFDLGEIFPPEIIDQTIINVSPIGDPYLFVETAFIEENLLKIGVFSEPIHGSGRLYLEIELLFPEPYEAMFFWGTHFIHITPAEPVYFECPFTFNEDDGFVHINWVEECTYPLEHPLRSVLVVDETRLYQQRGGGNYTIPIEPGEHLVELYVDDFQINNAVYSQMIIVTGNKENKIQKENYVVYPNPFEEICKFDCPDNCSIKVYNITGNIVENLQEGAKQWKPSSELPFGIYFIQFYDEKNTKTLKVVYGK